MTSTRVANPAAATSRPLTMRNQSKTGRSLASHHLRNPVAAQSVSQTAPFEVICDKPAESTEHSDIVKCIVACESRFYSAG